MGKHGESIQELTCDVIKWWLCILLSSKAGLPCKPEAFSIEKRPDVLDADGTTTWRRDRWTRMGLQKWRPDNHGDRTQTGETWDMRIREGSQQIIAKYYVIKKLN